MKEPTGFKGAYRGLWRTGKISPKGWETRAASVKNHFCPVKKPYSLRLKPPPFLLVPQKICFYTDQF
jgi:hypothetical protein